MNKKNLKRNVSLALAGLTLVGTTSGVYYANQVNSMNTLKQKAIVMSKQYVENNNIAVEDSIKTGVSLLSEQGYAKDFDQACIKNSYVNVTNNNGTYEYDPVINCNDDNSFYNTMVKTAKEQNSKVSTLGIIEGILTVDIIKSEENPTNQNVEVSIVAKEQIAEVNGWTRSVDGKILTKVFEKNETLFVTIQSEANPAKKEIIKVVVSNIDKVAPTGEVTANITTPTNKDVILTLKTSEDVTITNSASSNVAKKDNRTYTVTMEQNGTFTFKFKDEAGNEGTAKYKVTNIDKSVPVITGINNGYHTNKDVTLSFDKGTGLLNGVNFVSGTTITKEGKYTLVVTDAASNTATVSFVIDKSAPVVESVADGKTYNTSVTPTFGEGEATLNGEDFISGTTIKEDGDYTLIITDKAGNTTTIHFSIDATAPTGVITADKTTPTNKDVVLTLKTDEDVTIVNASTQVQKVDNRTYTVTMGQNGTFTVHFKDAAGNKATATYEVKNIDKDAPIVSGVTNKTDYNVNVTPTFNEGEATLNGKEFVSGTTIKEDGDYTLVVTDKAGNSTTVEFVVDKTAPVVEGVTDGNIYNVNVTPTFNEGTATLNGKAFTSGTDVTNEGTYTLVVTDKAGNKTTVKFSIDKTAPTGVIVASTTAPTKGSVILTLTTSEDVINTNAASSKVQKVNDRTYTVEIKENQKFSFKFKDKAGNTGRASYTVSNIDKVAPTVTNVEYVPELTANKRSASDVTVIITYNEALKNAPTNWAFVSGSTSKITRTYTSEAAKDARIIEQVIVTDIAGNTSDAETIEFVIDKTAPIVSGVENGHYYKETVTPTFNEGEATLNGNEFTSGTDVTTEGEYTLVVTDEVGNKTTIKFVIDKTAPVVEGVKDGNSYNETVTPTFNEGNATLNGAPFASGTEVSTEGNYTLVVTDKAGNKTTVKFEIDKTAPVVEGVIDGNSYNVDVTPTFNEGNATLNGDDFTSGTTVKDEGNYTLVVTDKAGNTTTVKFEIDKTAPVVEGVKDGNIYNVDVTPTFNEGNATLNGTPFVSGTTVTNEGNYTLVVTDKAGNTTTIKFEIDKTAPVVSGVEHGHYYNKDVTPTFNEGTATLNGKDFASGTTVKDEGKYTLVVTDKAGNSTTVKFVIDKTAPIVEGVKDGHYYNENVTPTFNEGTATLNGNEFTSGTEVSTEGNYTLVVTDKAGNSTTVEFVIDKTAPIVEGVTDGGIYNVDVTPTFNEGTATLNGNEFTSGTVVSKEGEYTLVVTDKAGNKTTIKFEIDKTAPVVEGVEDGHYYNETVTPTFSEGSATLNGNEFTSGTDITAEGNYTLVVTDEVGNKTTIKFVIDKTAPIVSGVKHGSHYNVDVTPTFNEGTATLNGNEFTSGTVVSKEGKYTLVVTDKAGNTTKVVFVIDKTAPVVEGVEHGHYYNENVTPTFNEGTATLNGNEFTSGTVVKKDKVYTLVVTDKAGNKTTVVFAIDKTAPVVEGVTDGSIYNTNVTPTFNEGEATLNGAPFVSGTEVSTEGNYTLVVTDKAGNTTTIKFEIDKTAPVVEGVIDGTIYNTDVTPTFNEGNATLNGSEFTSGTTVKEEGSYTLVVTDEASNKTTIKFEIDKTAPVVEGVIDGKHYNTNVTPTFNEGNATLNGAPFVSGTEVSIEGNYTLVVTDQAGNKTTVEFVIDKTAPVVTGVENGHYYNVDVTPIFSEGVATLNGGEFTSKTTIKEEGKYTLVVTDEASNTTKIKFVIDKTAPTVEGVENGHYYKETVTPTFNEGTATLNGAPFVSGTEVSTEGNYTLIVTDKAGNSTTVVFAIDKAAPVVSGVKHGHTYNVDITPTFNEGSATLNGKDFISGTTIAKDGKYTLVVTDKAGNTTKVQFIIDKTAPVVEGVEHGKYYNTDVTPTFNEGNATLNGKEFTSGTTVGFEGIYTLVVTDKAGNKTTVIFGIDKTSPIVEGVEDGHYYNTNVTPTFNDGTAKLNGKDFTSGTIVSEEGEYTLVVTDQASNTTTIHFEIDKTAPTVEGVEHGHYYNTNVIPTFSEGVATLNGNEFTSGTTVKTQKVYTLIVTDKAGNKTTVVFAIDKTAPIVEGVEDGHSYNTSVTPTFNEGNATLNGAPFVSGTTLTQDGNYVLVVTDKANNKTTVKFAIDSIAPVISGVKNGTYYNTDVTPTFNEGTATLNGSEFTSGTTIKEDGNYTLIVTDKAGNKTVVKFAIDKEAPIVEGVENGTYYDGNVTPTFNEGNATLNGAPFVSGTTLTQDGIYVLVVTDKAGNKTTVKFGIDRIAPVVSGVQNGKAYNTNVTPTFNEGTATLNGTKFVNGTVITKEGAYTLVVTDAIGHKTTVTFSVDKTAPVIKLNGANPQVIEYGSSYKELGATVTDNLDTSVKVVTDASSVDVSVTGTYQVTYQATDKAGNRTVVTRTVNVVTATASSLFRTANGCKAGEDCYNTKASNNYVWYSGYLWRVIKVNSDNTLKLVTEDSVAGFSYDDSSSTFNGSHASEWLNKNFYQSLNNAGSIVVTGNYCNELMTSLSKVRYTCNSSSITKAKVGLLTIDEYNILGAEGGFLNNGDQFFTMTPTTAKSVWVVKSDGSKERGYYVTEPYALRPTITIASTTAIATGNGTSTNPYHFVNDHHGSAGTSLNTRKPGEYVSFANKTWRIVKSGPVTRLVLDSYFTEKGSYAQVKYGTVGSFNTKSGIGNYLNTTVYNSLFNTAEKNALVKAKWYYNTYALGQNPITTTLVSSSKVTEAYVGLVRVGDIMSGSSSTSRVDKFTSWTLNSSYENVWYTTWGGTSDYSSPSSVRGVKPVIELNSRVTIRSGNGTSTNPYTLNY